jgi:hypothetical protein
MASRTAKKAGTTVTLENSLDQPISDEQLGQRAEKDTDERKLIIGMDKSDTLGAALPEHALAHVFPKMSPDEYANLKYDIYQHGQLVPIYTYDGQIIDGRHRYRATRELGLTPIIEEYTGDSVAYFVIGMNLNRRHLSVSQRASIALDVLPFFEEEARARMQSGSTTGDTEAVIGTARDAAGKVMQVSGRSVANAKVVKELAPDLHEKVTSGEMTVNSALKEARNRPNADGSPRIPVARQPKPPQEDRVEGAIMELIDVLAVWVGEYGRVPQLKPLAVQVKAWVKVAEAAQAEGMDAGIDMDTFNSDDYEDEEDEPTELTRANELADSEE